MPGPKNRSTCSPGAATSRLAPMMSAPQLHSRTARLMVVCAIGTMLVLWVRLAMPASGLDIPHRPLMGRPMVLTARHLPPLHPPIKVNLHNGYHPAFLRDLNISTPSQMSRVGHLHSVLMGVSDPSCDDGRTNLAIDWEDGAQPHQCPMDPVLPPEKPLLPIIDCQHRLPDDIPLRHVCMNATIQYDPGVPTYGHHRPLWPVYGTYRYLPPQRWLHSVEHGAVVLLHHPCVERARLRRLKSLLARCLYKHVVTPSGRVGWSRPLVLVAHGCQFHMSLINTELVVAFVRAHALHGKEGRLCRQGQFRDQLLRSATPPAGSDVNDTNICAFFPRPTASDSIFFRDHVIGE